MDQADRSTHASSNCALHFFSCLPTIAIAVILQAVTMFACMAFCLTGCLQTSAGHTICVRKCWARCALNTAWLPSHTLLAAGMLLFVLQLLACAC